MLSFAHPRFGWRPRLHPAFGHCGFVFGQHGITDEIFEELFFPRGKRVFGTDGVFGFHSVLKFGGGLEFDRHGDLRQDFNFVRNGIVTHRRDFEEGEPPTREVGVQFGDGGHVSGRERIQAIGFRVTHEFRVFRRARDPGQWRLEGQDFLFNPEILPQVHHPPIPDGVTADEELAVDLDNTVYALDSSTVDLSLTLFSWATFRKTKAGIKIHTQIDLRGSIPTCIHVTDARQHDINWLDMLTGTLPHAVADRVVFPVGQRSFGNTPFLRKQFKRSKDSGLDFGHRLFDCGHSAQGNEAAGYSSQNISGYL